MRRAWIIALILLLWPSDAFGARREPRVLGIHVVGERGASHKVPISGERVKLETKEIFSDANVDSVWIEESPETPNTHDVAVRFHSNASARFRTFTGGRVGQRVAILVDGRLTAAPVVREAVDGRRIPIAFGLTKGEAEALAERIRARVVPIDSPTSGSQR